MNTGQGLGPAGASGNETGQKKMCQPPTDDSLSVTWAASGRSAIGRATSVPAREDAVHLHGKRLSSPSEPAALQSSAPSSRSQGGCHRTAIAFPPAGRAAGPQTPGVEADEGGERRGELGPRATGSPSTRTAPAGPAWSRAQLGELARPHRGPVPLPGPACSVTHRPLPRPALAGAGVDFLPGELPACIIHEAPAHTGGILTKATEGTARLLPHAPARGDGPRTAATGPLGKEGGGERGLDGQRRPEADPLPPPAVIPALERARGP